MGVGFLMEGDDRKRSFHERAAARNWPSGDVEALIR
jgi:hypothetical protein